jgi:hypothetical protein
LNVELDHGASPCLLSPVENSTTGVVKELRIRLV